jgi:hypothetical protein
VIDVAPSQPFGTVEVVQLVAQVSVGERAAGEQVETHSRQSNTDE